MEENNRKGPGAFYAIIGIATLAVAIIGATFAFFSANATAQIPQGTTAAAGGVDLTVTPMTTNTNKNMIPNDTLSPKETSGLRIGFAAVTTRGCNKEDAIKIASLIHKFLKGEITEANAKEEVKVLVSNWKIIEEI